MVTNGEVTGGCTTGATGDGVAVTDSQTTGTGVGSAIGEDAIGGMDVFCALCKRINPPIASAMSTTPPAISKYFVVCELFFIPIGEGVFTGSRTGTEGAIGEETTGTEVFCGSTTFAIAPWR